MRPLSCFHWLLAVGLMTSGCATTGDKTVAVRPLWKSPAAFSREQAAAKKEHETSPADKAAVAEKSSNPFRKAAAADQPVDLKKSDDKTDTQTAKSDGAVKDGVKDGGKDETTSSTKDSLSASKTTDARPAGVFGPETLRLIDAELTDATPEERAYWYDQLKKVDPAVIPQILQARRLTAQVAEHQQQRKSGTADSGPSGRAAPFPNERSVQSANGDESRLGQSPVVNAVGRQLPGETEDVHSALYQTDTRALKQPLTQQNYEAPPSTPEKRPFAVTRIADAGISATPSTPAAGTSSRNPLSRLLPLGQSGSVTQASANSPSGISLLPPSGSDPRDSRGQLDELISLVESEAAQLQPGATEATQTQYIQRHVYLRLLYLMADHPERALTAIPGIEPADQEFWQQTLWAMANYFDAQHLPAAKDRAGQAVAQLTTATQRLREKADLAVRNLAFCRVIEGFGHFVRFPRDEFRPGDQALLYAEIENFKSEMTMDGQYRTLIRSTVEILSVSGEVRWHKEFAATEDLCINFRRDYYNNYQFTIPDRLPPGSHSLKLTVFDELSGKMVSQSINFVVR